MCFVYYIMACFVTFLPLGSSIRLSVSLIWLVSQRFSQDYVTPAAVSRHRRGGRVGRKTFQSAVVAA